MRPLSASPRLSVLFFFFNDTATTEIYTLSLHDALPISWAASISTTRSTRRAGWRARRGSTRSGSGSTAAATAASSRRDPESTPLDSSHLVIPDAVFWLKKKKKQQLRQHLRFQ